MKEDVHVGPTSFNFILLGFIYIHTCMCRDFKTPKVCKQGGDGTLM